MRGDVFLTLSLIFQCPMLITTVFSTITNFNLYVSAVSGVRKVVGNIWCIGAGMQNRHNHKVNQSFVCSAAVIVKFRSITRCGILHGCLAIKFDSCNNLLSSVHIISEIHSVAVSV